MRAKDVMTSPVITIEPEASCRMAADLLTRHRISGMPVVDGQGYLVGVVSEADLLQLQTTPDPRTQERPTAHLEPVPRRVKEVMTKNVYTVEEGTDIGLIAQRMLESRIKRLPVLRGHKVVGIVSRHDLIKVLTRSDEDLALAIRDILKEEGLRLAKLDVKVRDNIVDLSGADRGTLRIAEILARTVPGVVEVHSRVDGGEGRQ